MILTTNPLDTAIELITIRKDEYEAMRERIEKALQFLDESAKEYHAHISNCKKFWSMALGDRGCNCGADQWLKDRDKFLRENN